MHASLTPPSVQTLHIGASHTGRGKPEPSMLSFKWVALKAGPTPAASPPADQRYSLVFAVHTRLPQPPSLSHALLSCTSQLALLIASWEASSIAHGHAASLDSLSLTVQAALGLGAGPGGAGGGGGGEEEEAQDRFLLVLRHAACLVEHGERGRAVGMCGEKLLKAMVSEPALMATHGGWMSQVLLLLLQHQATPSTAPHTPSVAHQLLHQQLRASQWSSTCRESLTPVQHLPKCKHA